MILLLWLRREVLVANRLKGNCGKSAKEVKDTLTCTSATPIKVEGCDSDVGEVRDRGDEVMWFFFNFFGGSSRGASGCAGSVVAAT